MRKEARDARAAAAGDPVAFERLYRLHVGRIYTLACRMAGEQEAEDLTQEIFLRAWRRLPTFEGRARFGTWLHRLAVNHILSRRKSMALRESRVIGAPAVLEGAPARGQRNAAAALDLESALARLPDGAREVFVLFDVEGFQHEEIARAMGITVGTSKSQLHRARRLLREFLA